MYMHKLMIKYALREKGIADLGFSLKWWQMVLEYRTVPLYWCSPELMYNNRLLK